MKKILALAIVAVCSATIISCGPSAEEKAAAEKARQDSVNAAMEKMTADSLAKVAEQQKADSTLSHSCRHSADNCQVNLTFVHTKSKGYVQNLTDCSSIKSAGMACRCN